MDKQQAQQKKSSLVYVFIMLVIALSLLSIAKVMAQPSAQLQVAKSSGALLIQSPSSKTSSSGEKQTIDKNHQQVMQKTVGSIRPDYFAPVITHQLFSIFDANSELMIDDDLDGYFHQFSVSFDADVDAERALVYAELYFSRGGGPWQHYFTTDVFTIYGDSSDDQYQVITHLADGYPSDYYDVLIDLYVVGNDLPVATLSADDVNSLYALPLEDEYRDEVEVYVEYHESHGGSFGFWLVLLALPVLLRFKLQS